MTQNPYDRPSDPAKRHSAALTDGPDRAPARAMLKAIGFTDDDLARPIVGVATTWIETMPCNFNQRELAQRVKAGIRAAGGTPMEFNTVSVSDGVSMGTEGMKASLISREVITDSIELVARGHLFDGLVCIVGCDKTIPAGVMALCRLDIPGLALYNGSIAPGTFRGRDITIQDVFEAVGAHAAGKIDGAELHEVESAACPGAGACGGQFTANTMSMALEFLGISPAGMNGIPALNRTKGDAAEECGRLVMQLVRDDVRPSHIITREAIENAAASVAAIGRLDKRRAAPARDRPRARHPVLDRRVRLDRGADADRRQPEAGREVRRHRHVRRRRRGACGARASQARARPRRRAERRRPHAGPGGRRCRRDAGTAGRRPDRVADQGDGRPCDPARQPLARRAAS